MMTPDQLDQLKTTFAKQISDAIEAQHEKVRSTFAIMCKDHDGLTAQHAALVAQHEAMAAAHGVLVASHNDLVARYNAVEAELAKLVGPAAPVAS